MRGTFDFRETKHSTSLFVKRADRSLRIDRVARTKQRTHVKTIVYPCMRNGACLAIEVGGRVVPSGVPDFRCAAAAVAVAAAFYTFFPSSSSPLPVSISRTLLVEWLGEQNMDLNVKSKKTAAVDKLILLK